MEETATVGDNWSCLPGGFVYLGVDVEMCKSLIRVLKHKGPFKEGLSRMSLSETEEVGNESATLLCHSLRVRVRKNGVVGDWL